MHNLKIEIVFDRFETKNTFSNTQQTTKLWQVFCAFEEKNRRKKNRENSNLLQSLVIAVFFGVFCDLPKK
jgi:hypothetical protein